MYEKINDEETAESHFCKMVEIFFDKGWIQVGVAKFIGDKVLWKSVFKIHLKNRDFDIITTYRELRGIEEG